MGYYDDKHGTKEEVLKELQKEKYYTKFIKALENINRRVNK